jgi:hypothetical protein
MLRGLSSPPRRTRVVRPTGEMVQCDSGREPGPVGVRGGPGRGARAEIASVVSADARRTA